MATAKQIEAAVLAFDGGMDTLTPKGRELFAAAIDAALAAAEPVDVPTADELPTIDDLAEDIDGRWPTRQAQASYILDKYLRPRALAAAKAVDGWAQERALVKTQARNFQALQRRLEAVEVERDRMAEALKRLGVLLREWWTGKIVDGNFMPAAVKLVESPTRSSEPAKPAVDGAVAGKPWLGEILDDAHKRATQGAPWPTRESESGQNASQTVPASHEQLASHVNAALSAILHLIDTNQATMTPGRDGWLRRAYAATSPKGGQ